MSVVTRSPPLTLIKSESETQFTLWFSSEGRLELTKTVFRSPLVEAPVIAVRGKTGGAFNTSATFQWTSAVQAFAVLMLKAARRCQLNLSKEDALLEGVKGSMAASLDASIYKQTGWLDLFGMNARGDALSRRILARSNPGRRRFGPVMISLNERMLPESSVTVMLDNRKVDDEITLSRCVKAVEQQWGTHGVQLSLPFEEVVIEEKKLA